MWVSTAGWVDAPIDEVVVGGPNEVSLERWFPLLAAVTAADGGDGPRPGATGEAELTLPGGVHVPVRWRVVRRVRDTVHLEVVDHVGDRLALRSSFSPWHGGTAVELGVEGRRIGGRRLRGRAVERTLDRAIATVEGQVARPGRGGARPRAAFVPTVRGPLPQR